MDSTIVGAAIGGLATLMAAGISSLAFRFSKSRAKPSQETGQWIAEWIGECGGTPTESKMTLTVESDGRIHGEGLGDLPYEIEGFDSPFAAALSYRALDLRKKKIVGVFVVKKWPDERMTGSWYQLSSNNELEHGQVELRRL